MLSRLLIIVAALAGFYSLVRWRRRFGWSLRGLYVVITIGIAIFFLLLAIRGSVAIAIPLIILLIPFLARWLKIGESPSAVESKPESFNNGEVDSGNMNRVEAYQVLGLQPNAGYEEIQAAYRRLIQRVHPDQGGSAYLAVRLNQARKTLIG